MIFSI